MDKISFVAKGRIAVYKPNHTGANNRGYVLRSRLVMEEKIGRLLLSTEHVHHLNGNKIDDRPENLSIVSPSEHAKIHCDNNFKHLRILNYDQIKELMNKGYGYKKISKELNYNVGSVKSATRKLRKDMLFHIGVG